MSEGRFHVLTGGPGSGKTTLVEALAARGYSSMPEAGRAIIRAQVAIGGPALPWADRSLFAELMLAWEIRSREAAAALGGPVLFDRGIPDVLGYLVLCGLPVPQHVREAARRWRYAPVVFVAPFWPQIFAGDAERKQSPAEARATCAVMIETYRDLGYEIALLPESSPEARADFVAETIGAPA